MDLVLVARIVAFIIMWKSVLILKDALIIILMKRNWENVCARAIPCTNSQDCNNSAAIDDDGEDMVHGYRPNCQCICKDDYTGRRCEYRSPLSSPPGPSPANSSQRPPQRTNDYCMRNMAQGLLELGYPRSNETYNNYCGHHQCYYSTDPVHDEHTCKSCDSIDLQNIQDKNVYCQNTSNYNCYYNDKIQKCAFG
jgi:hypothetical protein